MALELLTQYRKDIEELKLIPSGGGCFEVSVNGEVIFSKLSEGRFPDPKELTQMMG